MKIVQRLKAWRSPFNPFYDPAEALKARMDEAMLAYAREMQAIFADLTEGMERELPYFIERLNQLATASLLPEGIGEDDDSDQ